MNYVPHPNPPTFGDSYGSIREMQEAKGMIEKGAPLWDYGVTGVSGVMPDFPINPGSGNLSDLLGMNDQWVKETNDAAWRELLNMPIPMAADGSPGISLKKEDIGIRELKPIVNSGYKAISADARVDVLEKRLEELEKRLAALEPKSSLDGGLTAS